MMGQVSEDFLNAYAKGKPLYANLLCAIKKYDKPKELSDYAHNCERCAIPFMGDPPCVNCYDKARLQFPPQSWCRVIELTGGGQ